MVREGVRVVGSTGSASAASGSIGTDRKVGKFAGDGY